MKRMILTAASLAAMLWLGAMPALAQRGHGGGASNKPMDSSPNKGNSANAHSSPASASSPTNLLMRNKNLDSHLTSKLQAKGLIPAGSDLKDICSDFHNLGQCIASIHVSHNLKNISFDCLKADVTGKPPSGSGCPNGTGTSKMKLGKAIQTLDPKANASAEVKKAQKAADTDIKESESEAQTKSS